MTQPAEDAHDSARDAHDSARDAPGLLARVRQADREALAELLSQNRERLIRMVRFRLDPRLERRVDPEDVLQEVYLNAADRLRHFEGDSLQSFFIWLRLIAGQTLIDIHRRHIGAQVRAAGREEPIDPLHPGATSTSMAFLLAADRTSPSQAAIRSEMSRQIEEAMEGMDPMDREVLALRHFEELGNGEVAEALGIGEKAASIRYVRALGRLKRILAGLPDFSRVDRAGDEYSRRSCPGQGNLRADGSAGR